MRLAALCVRRANGRRLVRLVDVWWAASIPVYPARLRFDLFGDDGFTTAGKGSLPMSGTLLEHAVVDVDTRDVSWEIDVPCYFRIKGLVSVVARHDASALADDATAQPSESVSSHGSRSILTQWGSSDP